MDTTQPPPGLSHPEPPDEARACYEFDVTIGGEHKTPLTVRWGGREVLEPALPIETPGFAYALIKFCIWGAGVLETDDQRWEISAGDFFWSMPQHPNILSCSRELQMANYAIAVAGVECEREMSRYLTGPIGVARLRDSEPVAAVMRAIMEEGRGTGRHREENCALLARLLLRRVHERGGAPAAANALARRTFDRCREYIERNFTTLTTIRDVAAACDVTVPYLCRLFDQFFEDSPYEYLTRLKMNRAESLLLRPASPIGEVAAAVGYKDPRLFARNFKATFGKSPTQYRNIHAPPAAE